MEIACLHDKAYEKENWDSRLAYFETMDLDDPNTTATASNPVGLVAAIKAYKDTLKGIPTGYVISLDACSSGLQFLSILVSCHKSFKLCGGDSENIQDSYTVIYDNVLSASGGTTGEFTRKDVKAAIMTSLYGSTATPEAVFGDHVDIYYDTMEKVAPGAWKLNLSLQKLWEMIESNEYSWELPDNFQAHIKTQDSETIEFNFHGETYYVKKKLDERPDFHKGLSPNLIHSIDGYVVREMYRRCMYDVKTVNRVIEALNSTGTDGKSAEMVKTIWKHYETTGILSLRLLDYLHHDTMGLVDPLVVAKLIQSMPDEPFELLAVHDCFRCHPNHGNELRRAYNYIMADINDGTLLKKMCRDVTNDDALEIRRLGRIDRYDLINSNYMIA